MTIIRLLFVSLLLCGSFAKAETSSGGIGLNVGLGFPFLSQAGINYRLSDKIGFSVGYNLLSLTIGQASIKLSMPEALVYFHPFSGAFFLGGGVGQEKLETTATETGGADQVSIDVSAKTVIAKVGFMWGAANGGFWFGIDASYIKPSSPETTITAPGVPVTDQSYIDAVDAANDFGDAAYTSLTFARFGWLF